MHIYSTWKPHNHQQTIMPKVCCKLYRVLDSPNFSKSLKPNKFEEFCKFIQESCHRRSKNVVEYENPNNINVHIYLFAGAGTRYLSGVAGEFLTFQPQKQLMQSIKWYPVLATKLIPQTKSLSFLGKTKLAIGLLLLISYHQTYLAQHFFPTSFSHVNSTSDTMLIIHVVNLK